MTLPLGGMKIAPEGLVRWRGGAAVVGISDREGVPRDRRAVRPGSKAVAG